MSSRSTWWFAVSGNRLFALGEDGLLSVDPWTLSGKKIADAEPASRSELVAGPRGAAWSLLVAGPRGVAWMGSGLHLWRPGAAPAVILSKNNDAGSAYPMAFDDSGELLATIQQKPTLQAGRGDLGWPFWVRLYDLEREKWWSHEVVGAMAVAFVGDRLVVGDDSGKLHVLPTPRARFQRSWKPGAR